MGETYGMTSSTSCNTNDVQVYSPTPNASQGPCSPFHFNLTTPNQATPPPPPPPPRRSLVHDYVNQRREDSRSREQLLVRSSYPGFPSPAISDGPGENGFRFAHSNKNDISPKTTTT